MERHGHGHGQGHGKKHSVVFVCLGNICRSTMAEIVMNHLLRERGIHDEWLVDSAGTAGYHIGDPPDSRTVKTCKKMLGPKMPAVTHRGRQISSSDFHRFRWVFCMDKSNFKDLQRIKPGDENAGILQLLGEWDPKGNKIVEDPYYGGMEGFEDIYHQITRSLNAFLDTVYKEESNL